MLNFPNAPADGEISAQPNGVQYQWNDTLSRWDSLSGKLPAVAGTVVQVRDYPHPDWATGENVIPRDDTIPQITEGIEYMTALFTPKFASSILRVDIGAQHANQISSRYFMGAVFADAGPDAFGAAIFYNALDVNKVAQLAFTSFMPAGGTDQITFSYRAGLNSSGELYFNGGAAARLMGGVMSSRITITEIQPNAVQPEPVPPGIMLRALIDGDNGNVIDGGAGLSINNTGTGIFEVTFDTPMPDIDYAISLTIGDIAGSRGFSLANAKTVNGFTVLIANTTNTLVSRDFEMLVVHQVAWPPLPIGIPYTAFGEISSNGITVSKDNGKFTSSKASAGQYNIAFNVARPDINYIVTGIASGTSPRFIHVMSQSVTGFTIRIRDSGSEALQDSVINVMVTSSVPFG